MDESKNVFQTMQSIMAIKTKELAKKQMNCEDMTDRLMHPLQDEEHTVQRIKLLVKDAGKRVPPERSGKLRYKDRYLAEKKKESNQHDEILQLAGISASNVQRLLDESAKDPSISPDLFKEIEEKFMSALEAKNVKYRYAALFSNLVSDAIPDRASGTAEASTPGGDGSMDYEAVGRSAMQEQRETWESMVFSPLETDANKITQKIDELFTHSSDAKTALYTLRYSADQVCQKLLTSKCQVPAVKSCITGLLAEDLLSQDQTNMLKEISDNQSYLSEIADVINLRLTDIDAWGWDTEAIPLEMRRQLNGHYRAFMHEEITQAIFLYYVGMKFATEFRTLFSNFYASDGWQKPEEMGQDARAIFQYYIGQRTPNSSIQHRLKQKFEEDYFMSMLPSDFYQELPGYDAKSSDSKSKSQVKGTIEAKQAVIHLMKTEGLFADREGQELRVIATDFKWFGPNLAHSTITAVLKSFGVTDVWLRFIDKFLKAPLRFVHDGPEAQIRVRQRGVPISHALSAFLGESVLFCLDYAVNEATKGRPLFRLYDDIWLWGNTAQCTAAWSALTDLAATFGIELNEEKTGSARLTKDTESVSSLPPAVPRGPLKWGFLKIRDGGAVEIDADIVTQHIAEFRRQLKAQQSIMSWVRSYNAYCRFLTFNMCKPANCLGRQHTDDMMATFQHVHMELFPSTNGSVTEHIKGMIRERYGVSDVPDGFIHMPVTMGGLELLNPFIPLQNMRDGVVEEPGTILDEAFEDDSAEYKRLKTLFEKEGPADKHALKDRPKKFLSYEEYSKFRRERNNTFCVAWCDLLNPVQEEAVELRTEIRELCEECDEPFDDWDDLSPYWKAVADRYGMQMAKKFGSLYVVEKSLLPLGMVNMLKGKVRWES